MHGILKLSGRNFHTVNCLSEDEIKTKERHADCHGLTTVLDILLLLNTDFFNYFFFLIAKASIEGMSSGSALTFALSNFSKLKFTLYHQILNVYQEH